MVVLVMVVVVCGGGGRCDGVLIIGWMTMGLKMASVAINFSKKQNYEKKNH